MTNMRYIEFKLGSAKAKPPYKKYDGDAGWDLFVSQGCVIAPGETVDVHTDLFVTIPPFVFGRMTGRSSTLKIHGLFVNEGIIDSGYCGELFMSVHNLNDTPFVVEEGMRLCQVIFQKLEDVRWAEVDELTPKPGTRGANGYGSTGE